MSDILARLRNDPLTALREVLLAAPSADIGHDDYDLHPELRPATQDRAVEAAVLIPIIARPEPTILFTRRTATLARHSGQVSFPGGRREPPIFRRWKRRCAKPRKRPASPPPSSASRAICRATAPAPVTTSRQWWACSRRALRSRPIPCEVADIFEVPLAFFLDPANRRLETRIWGGPRTALLCFHPQWPLHLGRDRGHPGGFRRPPDFARCYRSAMKIDSAKHPWMTAPETRKLSGGAGRRTFRRRRGAQRASGHARHRHRHRGADAAGRDRQAIGESRDQIRPHRLGAWHRHRDSGRPAL